MGEREGGREGVERKGVERGKREGGREGVERERERGGERGVGERERW